MDWRRFGAAFTVAALLIAGAAIPGGPAWATPLLVIAAVIIALCGFAPAIPGVRRLPVIGSPHAALTVVFDPADDQCVQDRTGTIQPDVQLRLRATNSGSVDLDKVRLKLKGVGHDHLARIRHDNTPPFTRSNDGISLRPGQSEYFDVAFCHLQQPQLVLQFADQYLTMQQTLPGNIVPKANRTPVEVEPEARRSDTNEWLPIGTQRYLVVPDGEAITLEIA
jgi:hypothetical protein